MTDDLHPAPAPVLTQPWATPRRLELQAEARRFAREQVKPIADEYDPQKKQMPRSLIEAMGARGYFGPRRPAGLPSCRPSS